MPSKRLSVVAASAAMLSVMAAAGAGADASTSPYGWAAGLPGCDTSRPAVAHLANQQVLSPQPTDGPVPCGMLTSFPTMENRIEVTNTNTVIYSPALMGGPVLAGAGHVPGWGREEGLARTSDGGAKWDGVSIQVWPDLYVLDGQTDNNIYVDHQTGRLFYYMQNSGPVGINTFCGGGGGATVAFSDDNANTWNWAFDNNHNCAENPTVLTGKPTVAGEQMAYPDVVYLCGDNTSSGTATLGTAGYSCSKSLTGGTRWLGTGLAGTAAGPAVSKGQGFYSGEGKDLFDPYPQCAGSSSTAGEQGVPGPGAEVQPLTDGTLVVIVSCNNKTYLSESRDEGATWNIVHQIPHGGDLRADSANNLYVLENATAANGTSELLLSHSGDRGQNWSPELNMVAPGVRLVGTYEFAQGTYASGQVGNVAVTYYGVRAGSSNSDGFVTETRDALEVNPIFWSGQVNDPKRPLLYNSINPIGPFGTTPSNMGITVLDIMGAALSPDGRSAWGSFVQDCGTNMVTDPHCQARWPQTNPGNPQDGFAGRLVWPPEHGLISRSK
jgi:hypothetical protein